MKAFLTIAMVLLFCVLHAQENPVVVELFTSQGCSSCPAADKNLTDIIDNAKAEGRTVYALSFHVDYWNHLGWKDPYSSKQFTQRQQQYVRVLNVSSMYTPQMIVNGVAEFVGSDRSESRERIDIASKQRSSYQLSISNVNVTDRTVSMDYAVSKKTSGETLNVAVVERNVENEVPRGENKNRKLHHDNVVRAFQTIQLRENGKIELPMPSINNLANASVILYVQDATMKIIAAQSAALKP